MYQLRPCIENDVTFFLKDNRIDFKVGGDEFSLELDSAELASNVMSALEYLQNNQYDRAIDINLEPYQLHELIDILDQQNVISDALNGPLKTISGRRFICEVERYYYKHLLSSAPADEFSLLLDKKELGRDSFLRWSVQYHWVTSKAELCLSSALHSPFLSQQTRQSINSFFFEETGHDKLLAPSLAIVGENQNISARPHIAIMAIIGQFLSYAHYDLPSFISLILALEGSQSDSRRYIDNLNLTDLPDEFKKGQITHEMLNITGEHDNEARNIAASLSHVDPLNVKKACESIELYYQTRAYMTPFLLDGSYHGSLSFDDVKTSLRESLNSILFHTLPVAISSATGKTKSILIKYLAKTDESHLKSLSDCGTPLSNYFWALWLIAKQDADEYLATVDFLQSLLFDDQIHFSDNVNPTIVESLGVDYAL